MSASRSTRWIRWYPAAWRERYGEELLALVEDSYGTDGPPLRVRLGLRRSGAVQHLREATLVDPVDRSDQVRSGALLVLCAWAMFIIAGAAFAKFSEQWDVSVSSGAHGLPTAAYDAVQWAGSAGTAIVAVAALIAIPGVVRLVRAGGFGPVRAPMRRAVIAAAITAATTLGVVVWAHHLSAHDRNGGSWAYVALGTVWALMICTSIVLCTAAVVAAASRIEVSDRTWRVYRVLAVGLALAMVTIAAGTIAWWASLASRAPTCSTRACWRCPPDRSRRPWWWPWPSCWVAWPSPPSASTARFAPTPSPRPAWPDWVAQSISTEKSQVATVVDPSGAQRS